MGKGSNTTTQRTSGSTTAAPDPTAYANYLALLNRASGVAATPYQGYTGEEVAPINQQQQTGVGSVNTAAGNIMAAGAPLTANDVQQWMNPYTQDVINATQADFDTQNARQQSQVVGNAAAQGALGGDRTAVAQALTAEAQNRTQAPVIAGLRQAGYGQALQAAQQQQGFGLQAAQAQLPVAQAQIGAGTLEQTTQQAQDTQARADYYQQQGYPFQVAQWLAAIDTGVGSQMGGTSSTEGVGTTQGPTPNTFSQIAGLGLSAASLFANRGGRISGVGRQRFAGGGAPMPYGTDQTWVPQAGIVGGHGAPAAPHISAPEPPKQQGLTQDQMKGIGTLGKKAYDWMTDQTSGSPGVSDPLPMVGAAGDYAVPTFVAKGGRVKRYAMGGVARGYQDGGDPTFDDRFDAAYPNAVPTTAGVGASVPAFNDRWLDVPESSDIDPNQLRASGMRSLGVVNPEPGDEFRLDPSATQAAMDETDAINGPEIAAARGDTGLPPLITAGVSKPTAAPEEAPSDEMAYASPGPRSGVATPAASNLAPSPDKTSGEGGFLQSLGIHVTPELRQGLLQAGLAMMASTRGGPGSFLGSLGEAGMAGVGAYNKTIEAEQKQAQQDLDNRLKVQQEQERAANMALVRGPDGTFIPNKQLLDVKRQEADINQKDKWTPAGSLVTKDGDVHPLAMDANTGQVKDVVTNKAPEVGDKITPKGSKATVSDEDAEAIAKRYVVTGDRTQLMGLGVGGENRSKVNHYISQVQKDLGVSDEELGQRVAEFEGRKSGQRTLGTMEARMGAAAFEVEGAIKLARGVVERVPRTSVLPLNKLIAGYQHGTLNPDQIELMQRLQAIKNTYAAVMARGSNVTTDAARARGDELLDSAYDAPSMNRVFDVMQSEIDMAKNSPERMRQFYRQKYGAGAVEGAGATPAPALAPQDKQALDWANANPNDPRAAKIKARLGVQ